MTAITSNARVRCVGDPRAITTSDEDRPIISKSVNSIGNHYREMAEDWIEREARDLLMYLRAVESALDQEMIFHPTAWIYLARAIVMVYCALRKTRHAHKWAERAAQHMRASTGSDGGWDAISKEPDKCEWWGASKQPRLWGKWA